MITQEFRAGTELVGIYKKRIEGLLAELEAKINECDIIGQGTREDDLNPDLVEQYEQLKTKCQTALLDISSKDFTEVERQMDEIQAEGENLLRFLELEKKRLRKYNPEIPIEENLN